MKFKKLLFIPLILNCSIGYSATGFGARKSQQIPPATQPGLPATQPDSPAATQSIPLATQPGSPASQSISAATQPGAPATQLIQPIAQTNPSEAVKTSEVNPLINSIDPNPPVKEKRVAKPTSPVPVPPTSFSMSATVRPNNNTPPPMQGVEWLQIPYDKAENEVLMLLKHDLPLLEEKASDIAIYEVRTSGKLPQNYQRNLRGKLEKVLLTSEKMKLKQCPACEESRLYRTETGELRYESFSAERSRPSRIATELGVDHLLYTEMTYTPEDLQMRVRMVHPATGQVIWTKEYSTADVVKTSERLKDSDSDSLGHQDSLSRVLIGEIAFSLSLAPGVSFYPTVDAGGGNTRLSYPSVDLMIGERFDRGRKIFGFQFGGAFLVAGTDKGTPLPYIIKVGPKFGYVFNPYNVSTARYSLFVEMGAMISQGVTTGYVGVGPEISMIRRFSVGIMPVYILPASFTGAETLVQQNNGSFSSSSSSAGKFGGLGGVVSATIRW